ncbi:DUF536 domain-containing protein [Lactiplantibacillus plantarum]|nr:DUF536 domain-containing protein [Lactiplantibacillus plantarum]MBY8839695.1 DUF536 domain-containing protein [Lactiplantibacillus plantarum]MCD7708229.1 DUF536 domain-containing protein [Lactiplantibacillus plantarum]MDN7020144.1 DUF536 domain-containing protein [Lactiplantibacillus plantarum]PCE77703.1 DUF536 domain-containing protein [Lactiplantibacillus plantarum]
MECQSIQTRSQQIIRKDRQIEHLTKLIDQQQQLQLAIVAENHQLTESMQKNKLNRTYKSVQAQQTKAKNKISKSWWRFW